MKVQQSVAEKYGKKYSKLTDQLGTVDTLSIKMGDSAGFTAKDFTKTYKAFIKAVDKLTTLVGE